MSSESTILGASEEGSLLHMRGLNSFEAQEYLPALAAYHGACVGLL